MVSDSVGLGAKTAVPAAFPPDWDVSVDGTPALFVEQLESKYVWGAPSNVLGDIGIVAGGYNYPYWDPARFDRSIDSIIHAFEQRGAKQVFWVMLREVEPQYVSASAWAGVQPYFWYFPTVNDHLEAALARHPNLTLVDWAAAARRPGITYDAIHLNTAGAQLYASLLRSTIDAAATRVPARSVTRVVVPDAAGTAAVALNLTTTSPRTTGFLTAFACGGPTPVVSNQNHVRDQTVAAAAIVPVAADGSVCVYSETDTNLIVDLAGRFPVGSGIVPLAPRRLVDTRSGGGGRQPAGVPLRVRVAGIDGVPADVAAVAVNVTATDAREAGFVTVAPCGAPAPETSNLNFGAGAATPNVVVVRPGVDGDICVVADHDAHLLVDLDAAFAAGSDVDLVDAVRAIDTRRAGRRLAAGETVRLDVADVGIDPAAAGVLLNVTATQASGDGFLTVHPCAAGLPVASNLNTVAGRDVANFVTVQPDAAGEVCVYSSVDTHVIVDVLGSLGTAFEGQPPQRLFDSRAGGD